MPGVESLSSIPGPGNMLYGWEGFMAAYSSFKAAGRRSLSVSLVLLVSLCVRAQDRTPVAQTTVPSRSGSSYSSVSASREPSTKGGHQAEINPGRTPHGSGDGPAIAAAAGAAAAA